MPWLHLPQVITHEPLFISPFGFSADLINNKHENKLFPIFLPTLYCVCSVFLSSVGWTVPVGLRSLLFPLCASVQRVPSVLIQKFGLEYERQYKYVFCTRLNKSGHANGYRSHYHEGSFCSRFSLTCQRCVWPGLQEQAIKSANVRYGRGLHLTLERSLYHFCLVA